MQEPSLLPRGRQPSADESVMHRVINMRLERPAHFPRLLSQSEISHLRYEHWKSLGTKMPPPVLDTQWVPNKHYNSSILGPLA